MKESDVDMRFNEPPVDGIRGAAHQEERVTKVKETPHIKEGLGSANQKLRRSGISE
jgi:hypothetical protein